MRGWVAEKFRTNNSGSGDTSGVIWATEDFTAQTGRGYVIWVTATIRSDLPGGGGILLKVDGSQVQRKNTDVLNAGVDSFISDFSEVITGLSAGSHTVDAYVRAAGLDGNSVQVRSGNTSDVDGRAGFIVFDVGPDS